MDVQWNRAGRVGAGWASSLGRHFDPRILGVAAVGGLVPLGLLAAEYPSSEDGDSRTFGWLFFMVGALVVLGIAALILGIILGAMHRDGRWGWLSLCLGTAIAAAVANAPFLTRRLSGPDSMADEAVGAGIELALLLGAGLTVVYAISVGLRSPAPASGPGAEPTPRSGAGLLAGRICPNCGQRVATDRKSFCDHCGEQFA